jgi:hypothetical protein
LHLSKYTVEIKYYTQGQKHKFFMLNSSKYLEESFKMHSYVLFFHRFPELWKLFPIIFRLFYLYDGWGCCPKSCYYSRHCTVTDVMTRANTFTMDMAQLMDMRN